MNEKEMEILGIISSFGDGRAVEFRKIGSDDSWQRLESGFWNFEEFEYRIGIEKPKPAETKNAIKVLYEFCRSHNGCGGCTLNPLYGGKDKKCPLYFVAGFASRLMREVERDYCASVEPKSQAMKITEDAIRKEGKDDVQGKLVEKTI